MAVGRVGRCPWAVFSIFIRRSLPETCNVEFVRATANMDRIAVLLGKNQCVLAVDETCRKRKRGVLSLATKRAASGNEACRVDQKCMSHEPPSTKRCKYFGHIISNIFVINSWKSHLPGNVLAEKLSTRITLNRPRTNTKRSALLCTGEKPKASFRETRRITAAFQAGRKE